jgi:hypothetical protein
VEAVGEVEGERRGDDDHQDDVSFHPAALSCS